MNITLNDLIQVSKTETDLAAGLLVQSFWDNPLVEYFFPKEIEKHKQLPAMMKSYVKQDLLYGQMYATSSKFEGIAGWKHSENVGRSLLKDLRSGGFTLLRKVGISKIRKMIKVDGFMSSRRNEYSVKPYLYLGPVAVNPKFQGKGFARKLLQPMFEHLDTEGLNCYLETQSESNVSLYQHFGFEVVAKSRIPDTDIPHWDMIRIPE